MRVFREVTGQYNRTDYAICYHGIQASMDKRHVKNLDKMCSQTES